MLESLGLAPDHDFTTVEWLGNTGSAALPTTLAGGLGEGIVSPGDHLALLGIGSGINSVMLAVDWQRTLVQRAEFSSSAKPGNPHALTGPHRNSVAVGKDQTANGS